MATQRLVRKKHELIVQFYQKKDKLKILPIYFELLKLHTMRQKKQRGIQMLNSEKADYFRAAIVNLSVKRRCFKELQDLGRQGRAQFFRQFLLKRAVIDSLRINRQQNHIKIKKILGHFREKQAYQGLELKRQILEQLFINHCKEKMVKKSTQVAEEMYEERVAGVKRVIFEEWLQFIQDKYS